VDPAEYDEPHQPAPTVGPVGFAVGVVVILVGLIVNPLWISTIGAAIAVIFAFVWARESTAALRGRHVAVEPEMREAGVGDAPALPADFGEAAMPPPAPGERFPRSKFLEASTLGLGAVIGGVVTLPVAGFALLPPFLGQKRHEVDLGPVTDLTEGQWYIATFETDPAEGVTSRRTAFVRNNGSVQEGSQQVPSFTIISNRCAHLGCPVQANGPLGNTKTEHTANGAITLHESQPAGFGCPCHGGQYDTEGNRTAGPPVRALDRYDFELRNGRLILLSRYSVSHVDGTGAQAKIHKYKLVGPGEHVSGVEQVLYPLNPPMH
jgi:menaquinol-cytochrome c reductase iron-sulfur subunit